MTPLCFSAPAAAHLGLPSEPGGEAPATPSSRCGRTIGSIGWYWAGLILLITINLGLGCISGMAHSLPTNTIINAFIKIESRQAHLVVRIPMDLLRGLPFPQQGPLYDLAASGPTTELGLLTLTSGFVLLEDGKPLSPTKTSGRLSVRSDRSFETYRSAVAHIDEPPGPGEQVPLNDAAFDIHFIYPISSPGSVLKIESQVAADLGNATKFLVRYIAPDESGRAMIIPGGSGPVALDPTWYNAALSFVGLGIGHILSGIDHLLFLFCLVIPFRRVRGLFAVITAFTVAHSVTLFASAFHLAPRGSWFPPFVETGIAASIVYMALENIVGPDLRRRWLVTGLFGLVHGFGFADVLTEQLQFAGSYLLLSLLSFNVGIEIGQICVLVIMIPVLVLSRRAVQDRILVLTLSTMAAAIAFYWMVERFEVLRRQEWPSALDIISLLRWPALLLLPVVLVHLLRRRLRSAAKSAR